MGNTKTLLVLAVAALLQACGSEAPPTQEPAATTPTTVESTQPVAIHDTLAFVQLVSAEYVDSDDYGKSSDKRTLRVVGKTNFPDGTTIKVSTAAFVPSTKEEGASDTYADVIVKQDAFEILLKPWNVPQTVDFRVFKSDQSSTVMNLFGESGERIQLKEENKGEYPQVCFFRSEEFKVNGELIASLKSGKKLTYEFQKPSTLKQPYEQALANYAQAWRDKRWDKMASFTQRSQNLNGADMSRDFDAMELVGFKILDATKSTGGIVQHMYSVKFEAKLVPMIKHKGVQTRILVANVVKEGDHWGVNVTSTFRGLND